jgi:hypothetical protein
MAERTYYYNNQIKRYIIQFMAIFSEMKVSIGLNADKTVKYAKIPIMYASKDRVVAHIKGDNTQNKPIRLPAFSVKLSNLAMSPELRKGTPNVRRNTYMPTGGLFPDDINVIEQRMPVPYKAEFELTLWASNQDQHMQMLEQIIMLFNPILQVQISDDVFDWTRITTVELTNIGLEENVPAGADRRIIQTSLVFTVPIYMAVPAKIHDKFVKDIYTRIGIVSSLDISSYDMIAEIDAQGEPYTLQFSLDDVNLT